MFSREQLTSAARSLLLPLAIALVLDAFCYTGYLASDDNGYLTQGHRVAHGLAMAPYVGSVRAGMSIPVIILYWLSSGRVHLIASAFALLHPILVVLVYCIGRLAHGEKVARMAAVLTAICPFLYVFAGAILPDLLMSMWIALSLAAILIALENGGRRALFWSAIAGISLGLGYSTKETALVMAVPAVASLAIGKRLPAIAALAAGMIAVVLLETVALRLLTGQWVTHLGALAAGDTQEHIAEVAAGQGLGPFRRFHTTFMELKLIGPLWTWMLVLGSIAYGWVKDRSWAVLLFTAWAFAYLTWGTTSLSSYNPPPIQPRYYSMAFVPATVVIARVLLAMARPIPRRGALLFAVMIGALMIGEAARNRFRAGNIYAAWMARGVEEAYRSASLRRPDLKVVLSPDYGWTLDSMFLETAPPNLVSLHSWTERSPEPPFLFVDLGDTYAESKLRRLVAGPIRVSTYDIIYPRRRLERLWDGVRGFFAVGPEGPSETWYFHTHETMVFLVEPGVQEPSESRDSAPLYPDRPLQMRRVANGHVVSWPAGTSASTATFFDQRSFDVPPPHAGSALDGNSSRVCVKVDFDALAGGARITAHLLAYGVDGKNTVTTEQEISVAEGSRSTVSLDGRADQPLGSFRVSLDIAPSKEAGRMLIGPPRVVPCE